MCLSMYVHTYVHTYVRIHQHCMGHTSSSARSVPLFILQEKLLESDAKYIRPLLERYPNSVDHHIMSTFLRLQYK